MRKTAQLATCLAVIMMLIPTGGLQAEEVGTQVKSTATDVILTNGTLTGQYVTTAGLPLDGAPVTVRKGGEQIATTTTNDKGIFQVTGLKGGVYEVSAAEGSQVVRTWEANIAPPNAKKFSTIVAGQTVRGQLLTGGLLGFGGLSTRTLLIIGGVATVGTVLAIDAANDDDSSPVSP